jgi:hypothetical protein
LLIADLVIGLIFEGVEVDSSVSKIENNQPGWVTEIEGDKSSARLTKGHLSLLKICQSAASYWATASLPKRIHFPVVGVESFRDYRHLS